MKREWAHLKMAFFFFFCEASRWEKPAKAWAVEGSRSWWTHCLAALIVLLGDGGRRAQKKRERGEARGKGSVQGVPLDEVDNWVRNKHCQQALKPPSLKKEKKNCREWSERKRGKRRAKRKGVRQRGREKIPATLWGESCYWKAIKLAFSRIDWKWRGLLKERDKGTIARLWPPYVALLSAAFFAGRGAGGNPVCLSAPTKRSSSGGA